MDAARTEALSQYIRTALPDRPIIWIGAYSPAYRERGGLSVLALAALRRDARRRKRGRAARKRTVGDSFTLTDGILCAVLFRRSRAATAHRAVPGRKAAGTSALWRRASASGGQMRLAGSGANFPGRSSAPP